MGNSLDRGSNIIRPDDPKVDQNSKQTYAVKFSEDGKIPHFSGLSLNEPISGSTVPNIDDVVPTVFRWEHGGRKVFITGSFNSYKGEIPMHRSGNDFIYIHDLSRELHMYRFRVDNEWRCSPSQPTSVNESGDLCNIIDVSNFIGFTGDEDIEEEYKMKYQNEIFSAAYPDLDEYTKEPPPLPPHLRQHILNKHLHSPDPTELPVPTNVSLNHLFCTALKGNMTMLGMTQRYRQKYVTTVYYRVTPN